MQKWDDNSKEECKSLRIACKMYEAVHPTTRFPKVGFQTSFRRSTAARGSERSAALPVLPVDQVVSANKPLCFHCPKSLNSFPLNTCRGDIIICFALFVQNEHLSAKHRHHTSVVTMSVSLDPPELGFRRTYCILRKKNLEAKKPRSLYA